MNDPYPESSKVLDGAREFALGDRNIDYGNPATTHAAIAEAWTAYRRIVGERAFDARDVSQMMIVMKAIRDAHRRKADNLIDQAGYAQCASWASQ